MSAKYGESFKVVIISLSAMVFAAGCASTKIAKGEILPERKLPRPETIWVNDFVPAPKDMKIEAGDSGNGNTDTAIKPLTPEAEELARKLGRSISAQLVKEINAMGLKAAVAASSSKPRVNDIVLRGYLYAVDTGNTAGRIFIGLGYGASVIHTLLDGYQMTPGGLQKLSSANIEAAGEQIPGGGAMGIFAFILFRNPVGLIVAPVVQSVKEIGGGPSIEGRAENTAAKIAEVLKERFRNAGWIKADN
ncbi:MAG: DUF4410 domain-containing protein [Victivallaceae bacterium]|nr:DUF4410 domain-containing protein [Victivallaceae bacterium]